VTNARVRRCLRTPGPQPYSRRREHHAKSAGTTLALESDDADVLEIVTRQFVDDAPRCSADARAVVHAEAPGDARLVLRDGNGTVIDRRVYSVRSVSTIDVAKTLGAVDASVQVPASDEVLFLFATARSDDDLVVWTDGAFEWTVEDPAVLDFASSEVPGAPAVTAAAGWAVMARLRGTGATQIHVRVGDAERTIPVEVTAAAPVPPSED
jgi:hypothetical protein